MTSLNPIPSFRPIGAFNGRGLWTLYMREVRRFWAVAVQTVLAPIITALLFLAILTLALPGRGLAGAEDYAHFLAPGLIMMALVQNAFANTSSSLAIMKFNGNIVDLQMAPLSPMEMLLGWVGGGITRGLVVGCGVTLALLPFARIEILHPAAIIYFALAAGAMMALLGLIGGIWTQKFGQMSAVTNFVITPLSFLSGTFYSIDRLPEFWGHLVRANPFFYMIDGFRFGFLGSADGSIWIGVVLLALVDVALFILAHRLLAAGWRMKP